MMTTQRPDFDHRRIRPASVPALVLCAAALLSGCAQFPAFQQKEARNANHPKASAVLEREREPAPPREPPARARERERDADYASSREPANLREGIRLYNDGEFDAAIKRLSARDISNGPLPTRLAALKYTAFSYCVTARQAQCRQSFDKALRLDPSFDLAPGEQGHPLWGPVFVKAKQAARPR